MKGEGSKEGEEGMKFLLNVDKVARELTFEELVLLEEGRAKSTRAVLARYIVNENGEALGEEEGMRVLNQLKVWEVAKLARDFTRAIKEAAINPPIGAGE